MTENMPFEDNCELDLAFLEQVIRYQDGTLSDAEIEVFESELTADPARLRAFAELQLQSAAVHGLYRQQAYDEPSTGADNRFARLASLDAWRWPVALVLLLGWGLWLFSVESQSIVQDVGEPAPEHDVRLAGSSQAAFFGELVPEVHSLLDLRRDYVLTSGLVEVSFPAGASAIIEAPAVFRILNDDSLALDTGRCSVHAPDGAEGFRVETPVTRVVDRGTRFTVNVSENSETEVQVIEGLADVYRKFDSLNTASAIPTEDSTGRAAELPLEIRLTDRDARRFSSPGFSAGQSLPYTPERYRRQLPDRLVRYEATTDAHGRAETLLSVTVQRDGILETYSTEDLIPVSLTWFQSYPTADPNGHLTGGATLPERRGTLIGDALLTAGVINPGGQSTPLTTDPVMPSDGDPAINGTPGFAVRFHSPVVNSPGPDVVFFELQSLTNPPGGDAFHVGPLKFSPGRRSFTVSTYDLTLASPESLPLSGFNLYRFGSPVDSLTALESLDCTRTHALLGFRGLAVAIDLSDLGFEEGEQVDGLFFQDADDDSHCVDPVFIGGLPSHRASHHETE